MKRHVKWTIVSFLCALFVLGHVHAQSADFIQLYTRGKLLLKQRLYVDGIKELKRASYTSRGQRHFGVFYYLSVGYFKLSSIQQASKYLQKAAPFAKNKRQKQALKRLKLKLQTLYGRISLMPQVDPDDVGRLKLVLRPKRAFSNKYKAKFFSRLAKTLKARGVVPNNKPIYLPKGEYTVEIQRPQCLKYGLFQNNRLARSIEVGQGPVQLSLQEKASCRCEGGQRLYRKGNRIVCECPEGLGWDKKNNRCETGKVPTGLIVGATAGAIAAAAGIAVIVVAVVVNNQPDTYGLVKPSNNNGIW